MTKGNRKKPWNYRMKLPPMPQEIKDKISKANKGKGVGPRPHLWITGPDPVMKKLRRRWLVARCQAKYWHQPWMLSWDQYRDLTLDHVDQQGRHGDDMNLGRVDKRQGWTVANTVMMTRSEQARRSKVRDSKGDVKKRTNTNSNKKQVKR